MLIALHSLDTRIFLSQCTPYTLRAKEGSTALRWKNISRKETRQASKEIQETGRRCHSGKNLDVTLPAARCGNASIIIISGTRSHRTTGGALWQIGTIQARKVTGKKERIERRKGQQCDKLCKSRNPTARHSLAHSLPINKKTTDTSTNDWSADGRDHHPCTFPHRCRSQAETQVDCRGTREHLMFSYRCVGRNVQARHRHFVKHEALHDPTTDQNQALIPNVCFGFGTLGNIIVSCTSTSILQLPVCCFLKTFELIGV